MRYVRTGDGRIMTHENSGVVMTDKEFEECVNNHNLVVVDAIADNIEDLCDEFVCIHKESGNKTVHKSYWFATAVQEECKQIYGAIWTEWGLKYVAKMNENGELELLYEDTHE